MVKRFFTLLLLFCASLSLQAQDTLFLVNKDKIICTVKRKDFVNVFYVAFDTLPRKKEIAIAKSNVRSISYSNGRWELICLKKIRLDEMTSAFVKGRYDATANYKHPGGSIGTGLTSFATGGIIGLIPAIACSATTPKMVNLNLPKDAPINNRDYMLGYVSTAKKMKQKKVWRGYFMGVGAAFAFLLITHAA